MKNKLVVLLVLLIATATLLVASCQSEDAQNYQRYYNNGTLVYHEHCQNCHGSKGEGLGALIPPLTDSVYLRKNLKQLPCVVRYGLKTMITVGDKTFVGQMPAKDNLSPIEIAEVLTFVGNSFGNHLGLVDVNAVNGDLASCH